MQTAKVGDVTFAVPADWTKEDVIQYWDRAAKGDFITCPRCGKFDINLLRHFDECDPAFEEQRREALDNDWGCKQ